MDRTIINRDGDLVVGTLWRPVRVGNFSTNIARVGIRGGEENAPASWIFGIMDHRGKWKAFDIRALGILGEVSVADFSKLGMFEGLMAAQRLIIRVKPQDFTFCDYTDPKTAKAAKSLADLPRLEEDPNQMSLF